MNRVAGWRFLEIGRRLERGIQIHHCHWPCRIHVSEPRFRTVLQDTLGGQPFGPQSEFASVPFPVALTERRMSDEQREVLQRFEELSSDKNYQPDEGFLDKLRAAFRQ